jgi:predicted SnoaL-like aldol condensation-catalyzing enzyme
VSTEANKAVILHEVEAYNAAVASKDVTILDRMFDECFTDDFVNHQIPSQPGVAPGREATKQQWQRGFEQYPDSDLHFSMPEHLIAEGDEVVDLRRMRWTDPATGKEDRRVIIRISRFVDGKIAEAWQLGAREEGQV